MTIGSSSENNSIADLQSDEREESPDLLANFIHDTTRKLENLTNELNNHDNDDFKLISKQLEAISTEATDSDNETVEFDNSNYKQELNGVTSSATLNESTTESYFDTKLQKFFTQSPAPATVTLRQKELPNDFPISLENGYNDVKHTSKGITIEKHSSLSLNLMQSVELEGKK